MYPDHLDVKSIVEKLNLKADPAMIWRQVNLLYHFLNFANDRCHWHGKHTVIPAIEVKSLAENWMGLCLSDAVFITASQFANLRWKSGRTVGNGLLKFPPTAKLEESRDLWNEQQTEQQNALQNALQNEQEAI